MITMKITRKQLRRLIIEQIADNPTDVIDKDEFVGPLPANYKSESFLLEVLHDVIAAKGKSKNYTDLTSLDGGTVGIAHFASDGLGGLYEAFGDDLVKKYFGKYKPDIDSVQALKDATYMGWKKSRTGLPVYCRDKGGQKAVKGTCYRSMTWWVKGMKDFISSPESKKIQLEGWKKVTVKPADKVMDDWDKEWFTKRGRAVGYCLVNSGGPSFLRRLAKGGKRSPNETIDAYSAEHGSVRKRFRILNKMYPDPNFKPKSFPKSYK